MAIYKLLLTTSCLFALGASAGTKMDKKETINGVHVESGKKDSSRHYRGSVTKTFPYGLASVKASVLNFNQKCNNSYKDRRKFTDKSADCKYHNENLVETIVVKDIKQNGWTKESGEVERYLLGRRVYNRGEFGYYELVRMYEGKNSQDQKTITITQKMLNDKEAKLYTKVSFEKDSAFDEAGSTYVLTEISPNTTILSYEYHAETDHWILNKEVSVPQVFASISKSINDLLKTVDKESPIKSRELASN